MRAAFLLVLGACNSVLGIGTPHVNVSDLAIDVIPAPVTQGLPITYVANVTNLGPDPAFGIIVTPGDLPAGFIDAKGEGWGCVRACEVEVLPVGDAPPITFNFGPLGEQIGSGDTIVESAGVTARSTDLDESNDQAEVTVGIGVSADLQISVTGPVGPVVARSTVAYSIGVTNAGPSRAAPLFVTLQRSTTDLLVLSSGGGQWSCNGLDCVLFSLGASETSTIDVLASAPRAGGEFELGARVSFSADPAITNNEASATTIATASADLQLSINDSPDPVAVGGSLTYNLIVENFGPSDASTVTVTDTLPAGTALSSVGGTGWGCNVAGQVVTCTRASLPVGTASSIFIVVTVPSSPTTLNNTASVASLTSDPGTANNAVSATTTAVASADLFIIAFNSSPTPAPVNGALRYRLGIGNQGPNTADAVVATINLPTGVTLAATSGTGWSCSSAGSTVTCTRATGAVGSLPTLFIDVTTSAAGSIVASASVSSATFDPNTQNNAASVTTTVGTCVVWNLASDFRISPNQENPNRDAQGNSGVWHFMKSSSLARDPATYSLLPNFTTSHAGVAGLQGWFDPTGPSDSLHVVVNATGSEQLFAGQVVWPSGALLVHPAPDRLSVIGWRSPITGSVAVSGQAIDRNTTCGNGFSWFVARNAGDLASGVLDNGGSQSFANGINGASLSSVSVAVGDFIYIVVDPRDGDFVCDSTELDVTITRCQ